MGRYWRELVAVLRKHRVWLSVHFCHARELTPEVAQAADLLADGGIPLGSARMRPIKKPRIGILAGRGVSSTDFGFVWHLLDEEVAAPHSVLDLDSFRDLDLGRFDLVEVQSPKNRLVAQIPPSGDRDDDA